MKSLSHWKSIAAVVLLYVIAVFFSTSAHSQTLNYGFETTNSNGTSIVPRLTWTTAPAGAACTASAAPAVVGWSGSVLSSGTMILPSIAATNSYSISCVWAGSLTTIVNWEIPTTNNDGSAYSNPGGFRIQYGRSATNLDQSVYLQDPTASTWTSPTLAAGVWFFAVRAYNAQGLESALSNVATKTLTAGSTQARSLEIVVKFPSPPTGVSVK